MIGKLCFDSSTCIRNKVTQISNMAADEKQEYLTFQYTVLVYCLAKLKETAWILQSLNVGSGKFYRNMIKILCPAPPHNPPDDKHWCLPPPPPAILQAINTGGSLTEIGLEVLHGKDWTGCNGLPCSGILRKIVVLIMWLNLWSR